MVWTLFINVRSFSKNLFITDLMQNLFKCLMQNNFLFVDNHHVWRRRSSSRSGQWLRYVQGRFRRRWRPTCRVSIHRRTPQTSGTLRPILPPVLAMPKASGNVTCTVEGSNTHLPTFVKKRPFPGHDVGNWEIVVENLLHLSFAFHVFFPLTTN